MKKYQVIFPIFFALTLAAGIYLGRKLQRIAAEKDITIDRFRFNKFNEILNYVTEEYVDSVNKGELMEDAVNTLLQNLDPHSVYISPSELKEINEPLEGNFDGIGIEFNLVNDTVVVISPISGGPSESLGIRAGDRILTIDGKPVAGVGITTKEIIQKLRGPKGTQVAISVERRGGKGTIPFTITRDKIPINSVDIGYLVDDTTGYIKISRFSANTYDEFIAALEKLLEKGMKQLIVDLRNNPGGYLNAATRIADEFLDSEKLIVYTQGHARDKNAYYATQKGKFQTGRLIILVDEGSASASEIVAGAIQDNDRGIIVGRRSFGKGLVQEQSTFPDGSAVRLTVARYFTPSGRSIQFPYEEGSLKYYEEHYKRYLGDGRFHPDSVQYPDSLKFKTGNGRTVFGGGGIMPDIFIPADTSGYSGYLGKLLNKGILNRFGFNYADYHRAELEIMKRPEAFIRRFSITESILREMVKFAEKEGIPPDPEGMHHSKEVIELQLKAFIARNIWNNEGFYPVIHIKDSAMKKSLEILRKQSLYSGMLTTPGPFLTKKGY